MYKLIPLDCHGDIRNYPFITLDQVKARVDAWTNHSYICHDRGTENSYVPQKSTIIQMGLDSLKLKQKTDNTKMKETKGLKLKQKIVIEEQNCK